MRSRSLGTEPRGTGTPTPLILTQLKLVDIKDFLTIHSARLRSSKMYSSIRVSCTLSKVENFCSLKVWKYQREKVDFMAYGFPCFWRWLLWAILTRSSLLPTKSLERKIIVTIGRQQRIMMIKIHHYYVIRCFSSEYTQAKSSISITTSCVWNNNISSRTNLKSFNNRMWARRYHPPGLNLSDNIFDVLRCA